jgi:hypothetical protein
MLRWLLWPAYSAPAVVEPRGRVRSGCTFFATHDSGALCDRPRPNGGHMRACCAKSVKWRSGLHTAPRWRLTGALDPEDRRGGTPRCALPRIEGRDICLRRLRRWSDCVKKKYEVGRLSDHSFLSI